MTCYLTWLLITRILNVFIRDMQSGVVLPGNVSLISSKNQKSEESWRLSLLFSYDKTTAVTKFSFKWLFGIITLITNDELKYTKYVST